MQKNTESELKYELKERDYKKLLRFLKDRRQRLERQKNTYFDDKLGSLRKKRFSFRIRISNNKKAMITLKHPKKRHKGSPTALKVRGEHECSIPLSKANRLLKGNSQFSILARLRPIKLISQGLGKEVLDQLKPLGTIFTRRRHIDWEGLELALDAFRIKQNRFWELEIETTRPKQVDLRVKRLFKELSIAVRTKVPSKFGRLSKS